MPCAIHEKLQPCPDCAALIRSAAVLEGLPVRQAANVVPRTPALVQNANAANLPKLQRQTRVKDLGVKKGPEPFDGLTPPPANTKLATVSGKKFIQCANNIVGCAGPNAGEWLQKGYETCKMCRDQIQPRTLQHSLVPVAWAHALRNIFAALKNLLDDKLRPKIAPDKLEDFIYNFIRERGEVQEGWTAQAFLQWFTSICVQGGEEPRPQYCKKEWDSILKTGAQMTDANAADFAQDFFLCFTDDGNKKPLARIYLNLSQNQAPAVYQWIVTTIVMAPNNSFRAQAVKIAGPAVKRSDTIVLYLLEKGRAQAVIDALGGAIQSNALAASAFLTPLAGFTAPAQFNGKTLGGISTGPEPPLGPNGRPVYSLGRLTSICIVAALRDMSAEVTAGRGFVNGYLEFFLKTTWTHMRQAGLDHVTPIFTPAPPAA